MKQLLTLSLALLSCYCFAQTEESAGKPNKKHKVTYKVKMPEGMAYIPSGTFKIQQDDATGAINASADSRTVELTGFFMDKSEITNREYRMFTNWVRDSIANTLLGNVETLPDGSRRVVMKKIDWSDPGVQQRLAPMYLPPENAAWGAKRIDAGKLVYHYPVFDYKAALLHPNERVKYVYTLDIPVYPDTTVLTDKSSSSFNEPVAMQYFWFPGFNNYPVVGVNLLQCHAFCDWRTRMWRAEHESKENVVEASFRLPTEQEWEWAAKGGSDDVTPHTQPAITGNAFADVVVKNPAGNDAENSYGLKNMAGSVSEWTTSGPEGIGNEQSNLIWLRPHSDASKSNPNAQSRIVRGGSWRNDAKDRQIGARFLYPVDSSTAYIGFRCIFTEVFIGVKKEGENGK